MNANQDDLQPSTILWLEQDINREDNRQAKQRLTALASNLIPFESQQECEEYLRWTPHDRYMLIVTGRLGKELVPRIHNLPQLSSIYIFCGHKQVHELWAKEFAKVKQLFVYFIYLYFHCRSNLSL